jgi:glucose-6-phosphate isomerase
MTSGEAWERYRAWLYDAPELGFRLDVSRMGLPGDFLSRMQARIDAAFEAMDRLEAGGIANPDEGRMVGHYWLRAPELAPSAEIAEAIRSTLDRVKSFAAGVHSGAIRPAGGGRFEHLLVVGIGGSALGPQLVADALGGPGDRMRPSFLDNTDPDGIDRTLDALAPALDRVLTLVVSKSGGTPETRNGMLEARARYERAGLAFGPHAAAVTGVDSALDRYARDEGFLARFPMWDWVGGRTSVTSTVGLLPAALQGIDVDGLLSGARDMDAATRAPRAAKNPAALLALAWHHAGGGRGDRDMVVLPYKDRLALLGRYLQQLVMESLGKERDLGGNVVHQGITVYGNKGSTDQHAYVQQLRDGRSDFFATFVEVLRDRPGRGIEVEPGGITSGDYLHGFLLGTRQALHDNGRPSLTITVRDVDARGIGMLVALFERAVGLYASMVGINAYHQPGVEAGKRAAAAVLDLERRLLAALARRGSVGATCSRLAADAGDPEAAETAFHLLERLAANPERGVEKLSAVSPFDAVYRARADDPEKT